MKKRTQIPRRFDVVVVAAVVVVVVATTQDRLSFLIDH